MEKLIRSSWWKVLGAGLLLYSFVFGLIGEVPRKPILNETIRNIYFHVPLWFAMMVLMIGSAIYSLKYLKNGLEKDDFFAVSLAEVGTVFGILGFATGALWGNYTWGDPLPRDPKIIAVEVGLLIYAAYFVLRGSFDDGQRKARLSAIYNIFAFASFMPLVWILPRLTDSLHPGNGGNPAFGKYDMNNEMRMVFYPAIIGWIILGVWISTLTYRIRILQNKLEENNG
jgi:heme exporter protein C